MLIYKNKFFLTDFIFLTYLYLLWAWPKGVCPGNYRRGLVIYAYYPFKKCYIKFERNFKKYANLCKLRKKLC